MLYDQRRNTVIIAFRGTKDPVDVITDITFFSTAFAPRCADTHTLLLLCSSSSFNCLASFALTVMCCAVPIPRRLQPVTSVTHLRPVVKSDARSAGSFSSNAAVLISRDPFPSLPFQSPPPPLEADTSESYPEGMEVHTGFLSSFERYSAVQCSSLTAISLSLQAYTHSHHHRSPYISARGMILSLTHQPITFLFSPLLFCFSFPASESR
jgi:hypothetical protein